MGLNRDDLHQTISSELLIEDEEANQTVIDMRKNTIVECVNSRIKKKLNSSNSDLNLD